MRTFSLQFFAKQYCFKHWCKIFHINPRYFSFYRIFFTVLHLHKEKFIFTTTTTPLLATTGAASVAQNRLFSLEFFAKSYCFKHCCKIFHINPRYFSFYRIFFTVLHLHKEKFIFTTTTTPLLAKTGAASIRQCPSVAAILAAVFCKTLLF